MLNPTIVGEKPFEGANGPLIMANSVAACLALGRLIQAGEQAAARTALKQFWKMLSNSDRFATEAPAAAKKNSLATLEVILDEFFNHDGDMAGAAQSMLKDMQQYAPEPLWPILRAQVDKMADDYLSTMRDWGKASLAAAKEK